MTNKETTTIYCELPQMFKLERKYGVKKYTFEDLDKFCKEEYGDKHSLDLTAC